MTRTLALLAIASMHTRIVHIARTLLTRAWSSPWPLRMTLTLLLCENVWALRGATTRWGVALHLAASIVLVAVHLFMLRVSDVDISLNEQIINYEHGRIGRLLTIIA